MALQVAEGAVVGDHVEAVVGALERPTRPVPPVGCGRPHRPATATAAPRRRGRSTRRRTSSSERSVSGAQMAAMTFSSPSGSKSSRATDGRPEGPPPGASSGATRSGKSRLDHAPVSRRVRTEVLGPDAPPVGPVDPLQERRDDLAQLLQHQVGVLAGLGQRVGAHPQQQHLVGLPGAVDPDVGQRAGRQEAPQGVERLGPHRLAVDEVGVAGLARVARSQPGLGRLQQLAVGVEHPVHVPHVAGPERRVEQAGIAVVAVVAGGQARCCRRCSGSTARGRPSAAPTRAPWSGRWRPARRPGGPRPAGPPSRRRTRRRPSRRAPRPG